MLKFLEKKNNLIIITIVLTIVSIFVRLLGIDFINGDYTSALSVWFDFLKYNGGFSALSVNLGVYNVPYLVILTILSYLPFYSLYSIKAVSIIFDYVLAISTGILTFEIVKEDKHAKLYSYLAYSCVIFLPTVVLNSGFWGQCDSIYTSFVVISLIYLIKENYFKSFIFLGISFAFKLQFIFILPLYIAIYLGKKKFPIYYFFIIIAVDFIMCLPAILAGRSITNCMMIYYNQTCLEKWSDVEYISMSFPGIYNLLLNVPEGQRNLVPNYNYSFSTFMILFTMGIFAISFLYVMINKVKFNKNLIIEYGIWSILVCTFFLPHMHDRYMYMAEVISIVYAIIGKEYKILIPILLNFCSFTPYALSVFDITLIPIQFLSLVNLGVLLAMTNLLIISFKREKIKYICDTITEIKGEEAQE